MNKVRSISEIGALWPLCKNCRHIAQAHNNDGSICGELTNQQCPTCHTRQLMPCQCKAYIGPSLEEFKKLLTAEEIEKYKF